MPPPLVDPDRLLDLALDAFAEQGYDGVSVRSLCRRLGVSHNLIHERFGPKELLWYAAVDHGFRTLAIELAKAANEMPADPYERLRAVLLRYVEVMAERPALIRIINAEAARPGPRLDHIFDEFIAPSADVADGAMRELERAGRGRRLPAALFHLMVGHGAGGLVSLPALTERFGDTDGTPVEQARQSVEIILAAVATPPG